MRIKQELWNRPSGWSTLIQNGEVTAANFVLCFAELSILADEGLHEEIAIKYPDAEVVYCSSAGEIAGANVFDGHLSLMAVQMDHTDIKIFSGNIKDYADSQELGQAIANYMDHSDLSHVFVISDGHLINGSELANGLASLKDKKIGVTGGLAGDGMHFRKTLVGLNKLATEGEIVAIGFLGDRIQVGYGSKGGWDAFGPQRIVTKSQENVLYELDGKCALDLYKTYLGEAASSLPSSALYFPLSLKVEGCSEPLVRTILSVDEEQKTMTFAGDIPEGAIVSLMKHNCDRLIEGAEFAAVKSLTPFVKDEKPELAILVSCVGRKIVLGQNVEEEIEAVKHLMGNSTVITGFYSYGELGPVQYNSRCELHNQTLTITTLKEI